VTRGVDVRVVALRRLVLDVRDVDRDTTLTLFRSRVDRREVALSASTLEIAAVSVVLPWST